MAQCEGYLYKRGQTTNIPFTDYSTCLWNTLL
jgi:hypothetical protein